MILPFKKWKSNKIAYFDTNLVSVSLVLTKPCAIPVKWVLNPQSLVVSLITGEVCNYDCVYCHAKNSGNSLFKAEYAIKVMEAVIKAFPEIPLNQIGIVPSKSGEIGLYSDEFIKFFEWGVSKGIPLNNISWVTNSTLSKDVLSFIKEHAEVNNFYFEFSIDGPKEIQDKQRPMKNGKSSYDNVMGFIQNAKDLGFLLKNAGSLTVLMEEDYSPSLIYLCNWLIEQGFNFDLIPNKTEGYWTNNKLNKFEGKLNDLYNQIMIDTFERHDYKWLQNNHLIFFLFVFYLLYIQITNRYMFPTCTNYAWNYMCIDKNGNVHPSDCLKNTSCKYNIFDMDTEAYKKEYFYGNNLNLLPENDPKCKDCPYHYLCRKLWVEPMSPELQMVGCMYNRIACEWALKFVAELYSQPQEIQTQIKLRLSKRN